MPALRAGARAPDARRGARRVSSLLIAFWAQRGRALTAELYGGNREKLTAAAGATLARRALAMLRASGHTGAVSFRIDCAYYAGKTDRVYAYSFILTDLDGDRVAVSVEHFHRHRAQIEERLKDAKLGQALRRMPTADQHANRTWMAACLLAGELNLTALICDLSPAAGASGKALADAPLRRAAKTLRRLLFCVPARIITSARQTTLRLPAGWRHTNLLAATYHAALALPEP